MKARKTNVVRAAAVLIGVAASFSAASKAADASYDVQANARMVLQGATTPKNVAVSIMDTPPISGVDVQQSVRRLLSGTPATITPRLQLAQRVSASPTAGQWSGIDTLAATRRLLLGRPL